MKLDQIHIHYCTLFSLIYCDHCNDLSIYLHFLWSWYWFINLSILVVNSYFDCCNDLYAYLHYIHLFWSLKRSIFVVINLYRSIFFSTAIVVGVTIYQFIYICHDHYENQSIYLIFYDRCSDTSICLHLLLMWSM